MFNEPWNRIVNMPIEVDVYVSNTLSRSATVTTDDYTEYEPDVENDEDGNLSFTPNIEIDSRALSDAFREQHYSIRELLNELSKTVESINSVGLTDENLRKLNKLAREGEAWDVDEEETVKD